MDNCVTANVAGIPDVILFETEEKTIMNLDKWLGGKRRGKHVKRT